MVIISFIIPSFVESLSLKFLEEKKFPRQVVIFYTNQNFPKTKMVSGQ